ncbi:MAG: hypothetical protein WKF64_07310, partial [Ilumatobacteraceae bacterium]
RLWVWSDGTTLPVVSGGDGPDDDPPADPPAGDPPAGDPPVDPPADPPDPDAHLGLGDAGTRALAAVRQERADALRRAKAAEDELDKVRQANQTAEEQAIEAARAEGRNEVAGDLRTERVSNALIRAGSNRLEDPEDAVRFLASSIEVGDDDRPTPEAAKAAVTQLLKERPYLATKANRPSGDGDGGARGGGGTPKPKGLAGAVTAHYARK